MNGVDSFERIKNHAISQSDCPETLTRKEAERIVRDIIKGNLGNIPKNLFIDSVNMLLEEVNGAEIITDDAKTG